MNSKNFEDTLDSLEHGYEIYMNLINNLAGILDGASEILSEEDYSDFKELLKDKLLEDL